MDKFDPDFESACRILFLTSGLLLTGALVLLCPCYFVATFTPLRPFASIAFCTTPVCFASSTSVASRCGAFFRLAAPAPRAATRSRRRAWLRIFVVRCGLPCDPPVGGLSCNGGMIPRFHRAVVTEADSLSAGRMSLQSCSWYMQRHDIMPSDHRGTP